VVNLLIFFFEFSLDPRTRNALIEYYGLIPDHFHASAILTSMFLHGSWMHVLGNMWFLWIFGDNIEDLLGHAKYLIFYLLCGIAAAVAHTVFNPYSTLPTVGASGAIAGVMGAYLVKFPRSRILSLIFVLFFITWVEIPAPIMLAYWFFIQLFSGLGSIARTHLTEGGGVAWFAHVGGFITGIILVTIMGGRTGYSPRREFHY
jgi:membrane associated rhomboid family serine protease